MALTDILEALRRDGDEEAALIAAERDAAVAAVMRSAREDARQAEAEASAARDEELSSESDVIRHRADLYVQRRLQAAREGVFQEVLGLAKDRLARYREDPAYPETLAALVRECAAFLRALEAVLVDPRDEELVEKTMVDLGLAKIQPSLVCWGGVVAHDGRGVFVRNTLEERLQRAESDLRRQVGILIPGLIERAQAGEST